MHPYIQVFQCRIPSYGLMMVMGILVAGSIALYRVGKKGLCWEYALAVSAFGLGSALVGASLLYLAVTYSIKEILQMLRTGELFQVGKTGLVFYGGLIGAIPGVLLGSRILRINLLNYVSPIVPCLPLGHAIGRIGCFFAGCCYGMPTDLPIGVIFTNPLSDAPTGIALVPVQLIESILLVIISLSLFILAKRLKPLKLVGCYAISYAICRFALEFVRFDSVRGIWSGLSTSQWISIILFVSGLLLYKIRIAES